MRMLLFILSLFIPMLALAAGVHDSPALVTTKQAQRCYTGMVIADSGLNNVQNAYLLKDADFYESVFKLACRSVVRNPVHLPKKRWIFITDLGVISNDYVTACSVPLKRRYAGAWGIPGPFRHRVADRIVNAVCRGAVILQVNGRMEKHTLAVLFPGQGI